MTQKQLSIKAQLEGYGFITETAVVKIELGTRFVPDYEVRILVYLLGTTTDYLLSDSGIKSSM